jgi:hypothetical protein
MSARARTVALILAGIVAGSLLGGPAVAHTGRKVGHLVNRHLVNFFYTEAEADGRFINSNEKASDSNLLDGIDSAGFLKVAGKAADSDLLDGINSTGFLPVAGKAADADKLDNIDSAAFLLGTSTLAGTFSCPGSGFYPFPFETSYDGDGLGKRFRDAGAGRVRCAAHLPNGAVVSGVTFTVFDSDAVTDVIDCVLLRTDLTPPIVGEANVSTPVATAAAPGETTIAAPSLIAGTTTIANSSFAYSLECRLNSGDSGNGIFGAVVSYTVPASAG